LRKYQIFSGKYKEMRAEGGEIKSDAERRAMSEKRRFKEKREFKKRLDEEDDNNGGYGRDRFAGRGRQNDYGKKRPERSFRDRDDDRTDRSDRGERKSFDRSFRDRDKRPFKGNRDNDRRFNKSYGKEKKYRNDFEDFDD
jgi:putative N6-adenine-specific DNA methylase